MLFSNQHGISPALTSAKALTNASNPCGACMTELGCSSSSGAGVEDSAAAVTISSYSIISIHSCLPPKPLFLTSNPGFAGFGGSGVGTSCSFSIAVSSICVVSVPFEEVDMGEGSAISLGLLVGVVER